MYKIPSVLSEFLLIFVFPFFFKVLTPEEKRFILLVERGDTASVAKTILAFRDKVHSRILLATTINILRTSPSYFSPSFST